jgi:hypothetical protein
VLKHFRGMTRLSFLLLFLAGLTVCLAADPKPGPTVQFCATVQEVVPLKGFSGTVVSIDPGPQFVLTLQIVSIGGNTNLAAGSLLKYAVHNPTKIFGGQPVKGRAYDFEVDRKTNGNRSTYSNLRLGKPANSAGSP